MVTFKEQQLLFGIQSNGKEALLSFVEIGSLEDEELDIFFCRANKNWLDDLSPGGLYRLESKNGKLIQFIKDRDFIITQPYYIMLLEHNHVLLKKKGDFIRRDYYTFADWSSLINYRPTLSQKLITRALKFLAYGAASIIPCVLYVLYLFFVFSRDSISFSTALMAFAALPLLIFLIVFLVTVLDYSFLKWSTTRYIGLRDYTLTNGGKRREIEIKKSRKRQLVIAGSVSLSLFIFSLILLVV